MFDQDITQHGGASRKRGGLQFDCHKIAGGYAVGEALVAENDSLCFYLVDPRTGIVIEKNHELEGQSIARKVLIFPGGKGSSVVQLDGLYQLSLHGNAPKAMVIRHPETVLVASAIIMEVPLVDRLADTFYKAVKSGDQVEVDTAQGIITLVKR